LRMIGGHELLRRQRREHQDLPLVAATHARSPAGRFLQRLSHPCLTGQDLPALFQHPASVRVLRMTSPVCRLGIRIT
jgi:hypothetical protein